MIRNPILKGFNPDPSICRVGNDYYIATSTFEWYPRRPDPPLARPGELASRRPPARPRRPARHARRPRQLRRLGALPQPRRRPFWLVYTDVKRHDGNFKDAHNYLVTAPADHRPLVRSDLPELLGLRPLALPRRRRPQVVREHAVEAHHRQRRRPPARHRLRRHPRCRNTTPSPAASPARSRNIFAGSPLGLVEGPHLFKRNGWYYLTAAEGGTGYDHAVTMARSRTLVGPYELHPDTHLLTSKDAPDAPLQRAGHGQIVETPDGSAYHTHLCGRPLPGTRRSPARPRDRDPAMRLGRRRLALLAHGGLVPADRSPGPRRRPRARARPPGRVPLRRPGAAGGLPVAAHPLPRAPLQPHRRRAAPARPRVDRQLVRAGAGRPPPAALPLPRRDPAPRLRPRHLPAGRRPHDLLQPLQVPLPRRHPRAALGRVLTMMSCPGDWPDGRLDLPARPRRCRCRTARSISRSRSATPTQHFFYAPAATGPPSAPRSTPRVISDEGGRGEHGSFTGAFVGLVAFDTSGRAAPADFASFSYTPR